MIVPRQLPQEHYTKWLNVYKKFLDRIILLMIRSDIIPFEHFINQLNTTNLNRLYSHFYECSSKRIDNEDDQMFVPVIDFSSLEPRWDDQNEQEFYFYERICNLHKQIIDYVHPDDQMYEPLKDIDRIHILEYYTIEDLKQDINSLR